MTSSANVTNQDSEPVEVKESTTVTTIHRIYNPANEELVIRDPNNRRSFINRPAYARLHRSFSAGSKRHSVDNLKGRFETLARQNSSEQPPQTPETPKEPPKVAPPPPPVEKEDDEKFTPASFGYPKTAKLTPPLIKPKPPVRKTTPKDVNSNHVNRNSGVGDAEEVRIVLQPSPSEESVDRIAKELSNFEMDGKPKERKRVGSFRKLFLGGLFGKDKKKKEEERKQKDSNVYKDNLKNESNSKRRGRKTAQGRTVEETYATNPRALAMQEVHERKIRELEEEYAQLHVNHFNSIRQNFNDDRQDNYVLMDTSKTKPKPTITDYISSPVNKYIDTSSSASIDSEKANGVVPRDTPPRAQETYQNIQVVNPKATLPINSERPIPNPYQNEKESPRTIERNLNKSNSKDYPDKPSLDEETYGTVIDRLDVKPVNSRPPLSPPKPLSLESTKLRLPPNREIYEPQPRVKSPIPSNRVSTEKIIATELLKNSRPPTPPKRDDVVATKPPMSPKSPKRQEPQVDRIVTNALVHAPLRSQTPSDNRYTNPRASTPVDLRMSVSMKMSPKKEDVRKSVEEYYWKQLKKLKEEEDSRLRSLQMNGYYEDQARLKRSRSLSPSSHRVGKRNLSLPRDVRGSDYVEYGRIPAQQSIPEDQTLSTVDGRYFIYDQNFIRNNQERRSTDSLQRPIFRRGSLTKQEIYDTTPYNKRVSFSSFQNQQQQWPTRNGYTQNPPQRRMVESDYDDEVFLQAPYAQNEPLYSNRVLERFRAQQFDNAGQQQLYGQIPSQMGDRRLSMDSIPRQQDVYVSRNQVVRRPVSNVPQFYPQMQRNPVYSSRQSITDSNYGQRNVTVRNKYADMYGQIHDSPQTGVVMGQVVPPRQPDNFVRGSRLTASANDVGKRFDGRFFYDTNYENRPLPPPPRPVRNNQVSDTESGSDASEIQRIMRNKTKKRGLFGK